MKSQPTIPEQGEMLILPDGKILAHNITPEIAEVLSGLDPENKLMRLRSMKTVSRENAGKAELCADSHPRLRTSK